MNNKRLPSNATGVNDLEKQDSHAAGVFVGGIEPVPNHILP